MTGGEASSGAYARLNWEAASSAHPEDGYAGARGRLGLPILLEFLLLFGAVVAEGLLDPSVSPLPRFKQLEIDNHRLEPQLSADLSRHL